MRERLTRIGWWNLFICLVGPWLLVGTSDVAWVKNLIAVLWMSTLWLACDSAYLRGDAKGFRRGYRRASDHAARFGMHVP